MVERPDNDDAPGEVPSEGYPSDAPDAASIGEPEHRREASARFEVQGSQSSIAELRDAMDPANQSLAEALRLSYRVLQAGILVLIVIFLLSGFQTVREGATGVKTIFGKIVGENGDEQLAPGLQPFWPYPVGELIVFDQKVTVPLEREFMPKARENQLTKESQLEAAESSRDLFAGRDGYVLTGDGDIAHVSVTASFTVTDAVLFLRVTSPEKARQLMRSALMRATLIAAGKFTLREFIDQREAPAAEIKQNTQEFLKALNAGITVGEINFSERSPPRFVEAKFQLVQANRTQANTAVEHAQQDVASTLNGIVGEKAYQEVWSMIKEYDLALVADKMQEADDLAKRIGERLEADDITGKVASTIQRAKARVSTDEAQHVRELLRLRGLVPAFENDPQQIIRQLWLDGVRAVLANPELEIISPPNTAGTFEFSIKSSQSISEKRRDLDLRRRKQEAEGNLTPEIEFFTRPGTQLHPGEDMKRLEKDTSKGTGRSDIRNKTNSIGGG